MTGRSTMIPLGRHTGSAISVSIIGSALGRGGEGEGGRGEKERERPAGRGREGEGGRVREKKGSSG